VVELAVRSLQILRRSPELWRDVTLKEKETLDPEAPKQSWLTYWRDNPINAWTTGPDRGWFAVEGDRFVSRLPVPEGDEVAFARMTRELVEFRIADYRGRDVFLCKVELREGTPVLTPPQRKGLPPEGLAIHLQGGHVWHLHVENGACVAASPVGGHVNRLPDLLRAWFGDAVVGCQVRLIRPVAGVEWQAEPVDGKMIRLPLPVRLRSYPDLRAAATAVARHQEGQDPGVMEEAWVHLPTEKEGSDLFAVRASGDSMNGGERPIRHGEWLVMRPVPDGALDRLEGQVGLVQVPGDGDAFHYVVKRVTRDGEGWLLRSDNPSMDAMPVPPGTRGIASLLDIVRPEQIAPEVGRVLSDDDLAPAFGLTSAPRRTGRVDGHLFLCLTRNAPSDALDRIHAPGLRPRPGETAYVLRRSEDQKGWEYVGLAHWSEEQQRFRR
jgi:hypothetical protein